jgi:hypothetical protein
VDLLNITLDVENIGTARARIERYAKAFAADRTRVTENLDFAPQLGAAAQGANGKGVR